MPFNHILKAIAALDNARVKAELALAQQDPQFDIDATDRMGSTLLEYAIIFACPDIVLSMLQAGASPNKPSKSGLPIAIALNNVVVKFGANAGFGVEDPLLDIITHLINNGADLKIRVNDSSLLDMLVKAVRLEDLRGLNNQDIKQRWVQVRTLILDAHRNDLRTLYKADLKQGSAKDPIDMFGYAVELEWFTPGITGNELIHSYQDFISKKVNQQRLNHLINTVNATKDVDYFTEIERDNISLPIQITLSNIGKVPLLPEVDQNFRAGLVTAIPVNATICQPGDHCINYLFMDDLCLRVNLGASADPHEVPGITISEVGNKAQLKKVLPLLLNSNKIHIDDQYLVGNFRRDCQFKDIDKIVLDGQSVANCSWKTNEGTILAAIFLHVYKILQARIRDNKKSLEMSKEIATRWFDYFRANDRKYGLEQAKGCLAGHIPHRVMAGIEKGAQVHEAAASLWDRTYLPSLRERDVTFTVPISTNEFDKLEQLYKAKNLHNPAPTTLEILNDVGAQKMDVARDAHNAIIKGLQIIHFSTQAKADAFTIRMKDSGVFQAQKHPKRCDGYGL